MKNCILELFHFWLKFAVFKMNQIQASLAPPSADPAGYWRECSQNHAKCSPAQLRFLQGNAFSFQDDTALSEPYWAAQINGIFSFHIDTRLQKSNAECRKILCKIEQKRALHKFVFCTLPIREARHLVCWWFAHYREEGMLRLLRPSCKLLNSSDLKKKIGSWNMCCFAGNSNRCRGLVLRPSHSQGHWLRLSMWQHMPQPHLQVMRTGPRFGHSVRSPIHLQNCIT